MPVSKMGKSLRTAATSNVNVDITVLHCDRKRPRRDHCGQARHLAGLDVEPRAVLGTFDVAAVELAAAEEEVLVRADIVDGVEVAVVAVRQADLLLVGDDA